MARVSLLPEEIQFDIYLRLPLKTIGICRCVCKTWCYILSNPRFVKTHLTHTNQTTKNHRLMVSHSQYFSGNNPTIYSIDYASISLSASSISLSLSLSFDLFPPSFECKGGGFMDYPFRYKDIKALDMLGSCNGLICLGIVSGTVGVDDDNSIFIWNPTTGEYKKIQCRCDFLVEYDGYNVRYGFGYCNVIDDYKVVRIVKKSGCFDIQVYTLRLNFWRTVGRVKSYRFHTERRYPGVLLNGMLHWLGRVTTDGQESFSVVVVAFDVSKETLIHVPIPEEIIAPLPEFDDDDVYKNLGVLGDCLCLAVVRFLQIDVWAMQEYGVRWVKRFVFEYGSWDSKLSFCKPMWSFENCEILIDTLQDLLLYDEKTGRVRTVNTPDITTSGNEEKYMTSIHRLSYVDSLVSLGSGTYVQKKTASGSMKALA